MLTGMVWPCRKDIVSCIMVRQWKCYNDDNADGNAAADDDDDTS